MNAVATADDVPPAPLTSAFGKAQNGVGDQIKPDKPLGGHLHIREVLFDLVDRILKAASGRVPKLTYTDDNGRDNGQNDCVFDRCRASRVLPPSTKFAHNHAPSSD